MSKSILRTCVYKKGKNKKQTKSIFKKEFFSFNKNGSISARAVKAAAIVCVMLKRKGRILKEKKK